MERRPNPYRPGFNQAPETLAGRDLVLESARDALEVAATEGRTPRPLIVVGSRGVGKTVLLGQVAVIAAEEYGWLTAHAEVRPGQPFLPQVQARLDAVAEVLMDAPRGRRFELSSVTARLGAFGVGGEVELARPRGDGDADLSLEATFARLCAEASERGSGVVVSIDELQLARPDEVAELAATLQQHVPDNWPLVVVLAGLPSLRGDRAVTYLERGEWHELGLLDREDTLAALRGPAIAGGRPLTSRAATVLSEASGGYPYAIQVFGHHAWRRSQGADEITGDHARAAVPVAERDLAAGLYAGRWADASTKEREYLVAVARLVVAGAEVTGGAVARELGTSTPAVSYLRDRLLKQGTLLAVGRNLTLPVPGMAAWIVDRADPD